MSSRKMFLGLAGLMLALVLGGCKPSMDASSSGVVSPAKGEMRITMLDIGTGDCILIQDGKQNVLVDTGHNKNKSLVMDKLAKMKIDRIHTVILTHHDADHIGNIMPILGKYKVSRVYDNGSLNPKNSVSQKLHGVLAKGNYHHKDLVVGDKINFGKDWHMEVLSPGDFLKGKYGKPLPASDTNNRSVVTKLQYGGFSMLLTGDIEAPAEECIVKQHGDKLASDVLKVAHHGSKTSSTFRFIDKVNPKYAIMSTGDYKEYHHPNSEVIKRIEHKGAKVYWTRKHGDIIINTDGNSCKVNVEYPNGHPRYLQEEFFNKKVKK